MAVKQTAGRERLGEFASKFAELNDGILFGEVWSREDKLSLRDRSMITCVSLIAMGITGEPIENHMVTAKKTALQKMRLPKSLRISLFTWDGQKHGRRSIWHRKSGMTGDKAGGHYGGRDKNFDALWGYRYTGCAV